MEGLRSIRRRSRLQRALDAWRQRLAPPAHPDPDEESANAATHTIALLLTLFAFAWIPLSLLIRPSEYSSIGVALAVTSVLLFGSVLFLTHRGRGRPAAYLIVGILLALGFASVYVQGSVGGFLVMIFAIAVLAAGLLLDVRASLATGVASILLLGVLAWLESQGGLYHSPPAPPLARLWGTQTILVASVCGLVAIALRRLRGSQEFLRTVAETTPNFLYVHDVAHDRVIYLNDLGPRWLGVTREEAESWGITGVASRLHPDDVPAMQRHLEELNATDDVSELEYRLRAADGGWRRMRSRNRVMRRDADGRVLEVVGLAEEVTERRDMEARLREAQKLEATGRLAGGIAHDFNNYLTVILGASELLADAIKDDEDARARLRDIREAAERSVSLTNQLLAYGRQQPMQPRTLDLNEVVSQSDRLLRRLLPENVETLTVLDPDLDPVRADPSQLEQVIFNLAINARDAMPEGGRLTLETANVYLEAEFASSHPGAHEGPYVLLAFSDTGEGIDEGTRRQLFEPFFTTKQQGRGTGLGLATVHGIVQQSGGFLAVTSEPERGSTFQVFLPQAAGRAEDSDDREVAIRPEDLAGSELLLLVEDDEMVRRFARDALQTHGYRVVEAQDGVEAFDLARDLREPPDAVVTDVTMPRMGGTELARKLRDAGIDAPVVFISGYTGTPLPTLGRDVGALLLSKPFTARALARAVRSLLDA